MVTGVIPTQSRKQFFNEDHAVLSLLTYEKPIPINVRQQPEHIGHSGIYVLHDNHPRTCGICLWATNMEMNTSRSVVGNTYAPYAECSRRHAYLHGLL
jgi:hypothetical protein